MAFCCLCILVCCSYVQASYARFLWDAEEEDEDEERYGEVLEPQTSRIDFITGPYPITAMS